MRRAPPSARGRIDGRSLTDDREAIMFRSIFTKTLRDYRLAIVLWGGLLGLSVMAYFPLVRDVLTSSTAGDLAKLAQSQRFFAEPVGLDTPAGYVTWKFVSSLPLFVGIWGARAAARLGRLGEERGSLDIILATPRSRPRVLGEGIAALVAAATLIGLLIGLGALAGEAAISGPVAPGGALLAGLNVTLAVLGVALVALFLAQLLTSAGAATGVACALMVVAWIMDGMGRISPDLAWVGRLSPYHLYSLSKPLIPTYGTNYGALFGLAALAAVFGAASVPLFVRRDLGGSAWPWRRAARRESGSTALARATRAISLRGVGSRAWRAGVPALVWWMIGLGIFLAWMTGITQAIKGELISLLQGAPAVQQLLRGSGAGTDTGLVSGILFAYLPILVALFALTQASAWARDLDAGRLELVLATPVPRWRVYLEAWAAALAALVVAPAILCLVVIVSIRVAGLQVDTGRLVEAFVGFLPIELVTAAIVFLLAGRFSSAVINGGDGGILAASFLGEFLNPVLHLPAWLIGLSIFHHYGTPLLSGPQWGPWLVVTAVAGALVALGLVQFTRGDVQRGN
jgi:ABC-2 type transport system permease protein